MEAAKPVKARRYRWADFVLSWYGILIVFSLMIGLFLIMRLGGGNDPIFFKLGNFTFRWYGIIITSGVIVATVLAGFLAERRGDDPDHAWRILPVLLVSGIGGARLWYVVNTWESYKDNLFSFGGSRPGAFEIWRGGIAIQGAVVGGLIGGALYVVIWNQLQRRKTVGKQRELSIWRWADYIAPGLVLAQAIGRWGNFMNNEAYGRETKMPWGIKIPCEYRTAGTTPGTVDTRCPQQTGNISPDALFHPTFMYESLWNYFTFLVLFYCIMKPKTIERRFRLKLRDGDIFLLYFVVYSVGRFFVEGLRTDSLYFGGDTNSLRSAQVLAIVSILVAGFVMFFRHRKPFPDSQKLSMKLAPLAATVVVSPSVVADAPVATVPADVETTEEETKEETVIEPENTVLEVENKLDEPETEKGTDETEAVVEPAEAETEPAVKPETKAETGEKEAKK